MPYRVTDSPTTPHLDPSNGRVDFPPTYSTSGGDSGSPVFEVWPDGTLVARGLHWSAAGAFSTLNEVLRELREVTGGGLGPEAQ